MNRHYYWWPWEYPPWGVDCAISRGSMRGMSPPFCVNGDHRDGYGDSFNTLTPEFQKGTGYGGGLVQGGERCHLPGMNGIEYDEN